MKLKETLRGIIREEVKNVLKENKKRNRLTEAKLSDEQVKALVLQSAMDGDIRDDMESHSGFIIQQYFTAMAGKLRGLERKFKMDPVEARDEPLMMDYLYDFAEAQIEKTPAPKVAQLARKEDWDLMGPNGKLIKAGTY